MYENKTFENILSDMLDGIPNTYDKREGSIIYDALAPAALELANQYLAFDLMINESFGDTASREYLIRLGAERGLEPYPATKTILQGEFTPTTLELSIGNRFNCSNSSYVIIEKISNGIYKLQCEEAGEIGNKYLGDIIPIDYIDGLETAKLTQILIYGEEVEETEKFRERYMTTFNIKAFSGNKEDYKEKTLAIQGVGAVKIEPVWNGGGTVRLTILDSKFDIPTQTLINSVKTAFDPNSNGKGDGLAPIGHIVTVRGVTKVNIAITTTVTFSTSYSWSTHKTLIENAVKNYLLSVRENWCNSETNTVRIAQIENAIMNIDGVLDIGNTKINGSTNNLLLSFEKVPFFKSIGENT